MAERTRRTTDERVAEIDKKIAHHQKCIDVLNAKKSSILNPVKRAMVSEQVSNIISKAKANGMTDEEIAEKLGVTM